METQLGKAYLFSILREVPHPHDTSGAAVVLSFSKLLFSKRLYITRRVENAVANNWNCAERVF